jgi:hypothetical protein
MKTTFDFILAITQELSFRKFCHVGDLRITGTATQDSPNEHPEIEIEHIYFNGNEITKLMNFFFEEWGLDGYEEHIKEAAEAHVSFIEESDYTLINQ